MLQITAGHLAAFAAESSRDFEVRLMRFIADEFPETESLFGDEGIRKLAATGHRKAVLLGLETETGIATYVLLHELLGPEFETDPDNASVVRYLTDQTLSEPERIKGAFDAALQLLPNPSTIRIDQ